MLEKSTAVTLATCHYTVSGLLDTRGERLLDALNRSESAFLRLYDAQVYRGHLCGDPVASLPTTVLRKTQICLAIPTGDEEQSFGRRMRSFTNKKTRNSFLVLPGYAVQGRMHLRMDGDEIVALTREVGTFLPVTDAKVFAPIASSSSFDVPIVIVNASFVSLLHLGDAARVPSEALNLEAPGVGSLSQQLPLAD